MPASNPGSQTKTVEQLLEEQNMLLRQIMKGLSLLLGIEFSELDAS